MGKLFGTFGVRKIANKGLTPEFASKLACAYGSLVDGKIAVGGDTRNFYNHDQTRSNSRFTF